MNDPITPIQHNSGNKAITILRIFLWLMPASFIPAAIFLALLMYNIIRIQDEEILIGFSVIVAVCATACVGYFDQRLALMQKKIDPPHSKKELARWTVIFVIAQIIIAPSICYIAAYGYCSIM